MHLFAYYSGNILDPAYKDKTINYTILIPVIRGTRIILAIYT